MNVSSALSANPPNGSRLSRGLTAVLLTLTLVLSCAIGLLTPYLTAVILLPIWIWYMATGRIVEAYRLLAAKLFLLAFVILTLCFAITAHSPHDLIYALNFGMFLMFAPMAAIHGQSASPGNATRVASLALVGTAVGLGFVAWDAFINGSPRPRAFNLGPIVLSNTVLVLGFLALMGTFAPMARYRWVFLAGPIMAIATVLLTGSRGPMLAIPALVLLSLIFLGRYWFSRRVLLAVAIGIVALGAVWLFFLAQGRSSTLLDVFSDLMSGQVMSDRTARIRLALYQAGLQSFMDAPWLGHGWARLMDSVAPYLSRSDLKYARLPQLHSEVVNFAVAAGVVGLGVYLLVIVTPLWTALVTPRDTQFPAKLFGVLVLTAVFVFGGLTDLMIGFEFHTSFFACISAILLGYCQDKPPTKVV